jgi:hypothetical protein
VGIAARVECGGGRSSSRAAMWLSRLTLDGLLVGRFGACCISIVERKQLSTTSSGVSPRAPVGGVGLFSRGLRPIRVVG